MSASKLHRLSLLTLFLYIISSGCASSGFLGGAPYFISPVEPLQAVFDREASLLTVSFVYGNSFSPLATYHLTSKRTSDGTRYCLTFFSKGMVGHSSERSRTFSPGQESALHWNWSMHLPAFDPSRDTVSYCYQGQERLIPLTVVATDAEK